MKQAISKTPDAFDKRMHSIRTRLTSRRLNEIISLVAKTAPERNGLRRERIGRVFEALSLSMLHGDAALEQLLMDMNIPPDENGAIDHVRGAWCEICYQIFYLNPGLTPGFASKVLRSCLAKTTKFAFCLLHSDTISELISHNFGEIDFRECRSILSAAQDSRSVYAVKALHWDPLWTETRDLMLRLLFSKQAPVRNNAYWTLRERLSISELQEFVLRKRISIPDHISKVPDIRTMLDYLRGCQCGNQ